MCLPEVSLEVSLLEVRSLKVGAQELRLPEVCSREERPSEVRLRKDRSLEVGLPRPPVLPRFGAELPREALRLSPRPKDSGSLSFVSG
jgi:hypothetical protein